MSHARPVIQGSQLNNLPLNVRQFMQLIFLAPMSTPATEDFRGTDVNRNTSVAASAGQRPEQNNYQIDGFDNREFGRNGFAVAPPVDVVSEFRVQTGLAPAQFGRGGGVIINTVTRDGTNEYHGRGSPHHAVCLAVRILSRTRPVAFVPLTSGRCL